MKRKFYLKYEVSVELELDDAVIDVVDDEWRSMLYNLQTPEEIADMIAYNMLRGGDLSSLDGWADQPDSNARLRDEDWYLDMVEEIEE